MISLCFSGCFSENKSSDEDNELDRFIGAWYGWILNKSNREIWTFCQNRSIKIDDSWGIEWGTYSLDGSDLKIKKPLSGFTGEYSTMWYTYKFSEDGNHFTFKMFSDEIDGEFYKNSIFLDEEASKLIGKWSNQTIHWKNSNEAWTYYWNCTFYTNGSILVEHNWYYMDIDEIKWDKSWYFYFIEDEGYLCRGTFCSNYSFTDDDKILNWDLNYTRIE